MTDKPVSTQPTTEDASVDPGSSNPEPEIPLGQRYITLTPDPDQIHTMVARPESMVARPAVGPYGITRSAK